MKAILLLGTIAALMAPCLWDSDTLDTELRGLPDAFDLVTGRWHRHGEAYYRERIARLGAKPHPTLAELDDLAVAFERVGERERAVAVMAKKAEALAAAPDREHEYRRLANLGTFHAHAGRYDEAVVELRQAVALNPAAHFGRERLQIRLIEYAAAARQEPSRWTQQSFLRYAGYPFGSFPSRAFADPAQDGEPTFVDDVEIDCDLDWDQAYRAVGGMLRFGGREGPELYRALGELFLEKEHLNLAWWAFRHAIERDHPAAEVLTQQLARIADHWREAESVHTMQLAGTGVRAPTEAEYTAIRASADRWLATFQELEAAAVARGEDVASDATLAALLAEADRRVPRPAAPRGWSSLELLLAGLALIAAVVAVHAVHRRRRRRDRTAGAGAYP
ncbi:MAG: hypothetical protein KDC98_17460 [Planctomycetes bacterium]|nr:hypothetical protein [Planctomycetota bacterium]